MTTEPLTIRKFDDMHVHVRNGAMMANVLPFTIRQCGRAIMMPNTRPHAILSDKDVVNYREEINRTARLTMPDSQYCFEPLMVIEIRDTTTPEMVIAAKAVGAVAGKVYPRGVTTNSDHGLTSFESENIEAVFRTMEEIGMLLLLHGEIDRDRVLVTDREAEFMPTLRQLAATYPELKIVLEHVSSQAGVRTVKNLGRNVAATITAHHLGLTLNDVIGSGIQPHHGCMPMPKGYTDRDALIEAATSGNPKFFLGSDSAPHPREKKECAVGACGVFSAPVLSPVLAEIFESVGSLSRLEDFTSRFGAEFYGLPLNEETITLVRKPWTVPQEIGGVVPFRAGKELQWRVA